MKKYFGAAAAALMTMASVGNAGDLTGKNVLIFNTFQGDLTNGVESDVGAFGMNNNLFATVSGKTEFPGFIGLYSVDISENSIAFEWAENDFSAQFSGVTPDPSHDRNYFVFEIPAGKKITAIKYDAGSSELPEGSAEPSAAVVTRNKVVTDFAAGVIRGAGFAPVFTLTIESE